MKTIITVFKFFRSLFLLEKAEGDIAVYINIFYIVVMLACSAWIVVHRNEKIDTRKSPIPTYDLLSLYICALVAFHGKTALWLALISMISFILFNVLSFFFYRVHSKKAQIIFTFVPVIIIILMYWMRYT